MANQHTIASAIELTGVGVHSGVPARVRLNPAPVDSGIVFFRSDAEAADRAIPALSRFVAATGNATVLRNAAGVQVATVEHLLAAAAGLEIDNLRVEVEGPELPILDGSALPFVVAIDAVGRVEQEAPRRGLRMLRPIEVVDGAKRARLEPCDEGFWIDVVIRYAEPAIGVQRREIEVTPESFRAEIGRARTFGRFADLEGLRARGLALGASLENTVAVDADRVVNPEGLRSADEFVLHKVLDVVGDLSLAGARIQGRFTGDQSGHGLNARLLSAVLATSDAYEIIAEV